MVWISLKYFSILEIKLMRIIEPHYLRRPKPKKQYFKPWLLITIVGLVGGIMGFYWWDSRPKSESTPVGPTATAAESEDAPSIMDNSSKALRTFTDQEFRNLYNSIAYPNTQELTIPPSITGNVMADMRVRAIAEKRGYTLRSIPVAPIKKTSEPNLEGDDLIQEKALAGWLSLKTLAAKDNIPLRLNSAYRSIEYQRDLFMGRLLAKGATVTAVAAGQADTLVDETLKATAIPGYSRHHTGYTIDLRCADGSGNFETSKCFRWIAANNYQKAKESGWIPGYPDAGDQGPEPEAWEYVWVGTNLTYTTN